MKKEEHIDTRRVNIIEHLRDIAYGMNDEFNFAVNEGECPYLMELVKDKITEYYELCISLEEFGLITFEELKLARSFIGEAATKYVLADF